MIIVKQICENPVKWEAYTRQQGKNAVGDTPFAAIGNLLGTDVIVPCLNRRVVRTDNFGRSGESPGYDEKFIGESMTKEQAERLALELNSSHSKYAAYYYKIVSVDYKLQVFQP